MTSRNEIQEQVRLTLDLKKEFNKYVKLGNFSKSAVLRSLITQWISSEKLRYEGTNDV